MHYYNFYCTTNRIRAFPTVPPRRPAPPPPTNSFRGRTGNGGRGRGSAPANRRGKRSGNIGRSEDPRRNRQPVQVPIMTSGLPEPIINAIAGPSNAGTSAVETSVAADPIDLDGLDFLEEFSSTDLAAIGVEDVAMSSENGNTEGGFTV
jgi:hypothetical protein